MLLRLTYILALLMILPSARLMAAPPAERPFTVVLDPGHGGKDIGCQGKLTNEKTVVLEVARRLGRIIGKEHPEVKVVYTRDTDRFVELNRRAAIANDAAADLFISIHVNSVDRRNRNRANIHGAQVYTLGLHRTDDNLAVAMRENGVIELESDFSETYQGFDPSSTESYIIFELTQNTHHRNSIELADGIQQRLVADAGRADKGVRQAGFLVLRATSMPAVLVELDFICNAAAERFLASDDGREKCARALADAFATYYSRHSRAGSAPAARDKAKAAGQSSPAAAEASTVYAVQIATSPRELDADSPQLRGIDGVKSYRHEGSYKYYVGSYDSLKSAKKMLRKLKKRYPEAFIIKMRDGARVP
ncbi:MAG: N-acetylmuramoyl-L-alanine amidase [Bacteroides sp.]|nr:N-acetylmuramoyl-L-alanine amidase [Bacteroides sp.]MCM1095627.1 N-acetylmuramoyl-L-alanine amidase [Terasakiella sp.]